MKIFSIGLSRTGAVTLNEALTMLGYRAHLVADGEEDLQGELADFDAYTHTPLAALYKELDERFPNSKFILTVRANREGWLNSCEKLFSLIAKQSEASIKVLMRTYGTNVFDREVFNTAYERHMENVMEYFKDRHDDLLILDITSGEGFEKLCPFLGKPILNQPMPRRNTMESLHKPSKKIKRFLVNWMMAREIKWFLKKLIGK